MEWSWLNIPLALLFVCCWAGIPLWLTLTRWNTEITAKHAAIAAEGSIARAGLRAAGSGSRARDRQPGLCRSRQPAGPLIPCLATPSLRARQRAGPAGSGGSPRGPGIDCQNIGGQPYAGTAPTERTCHGPL
jgi:hypothetical protein